MPSRYNFIHHYEAEPEQEAGTVHLQICDLEYKEVKNFA